MIRKKLLSLSTMNMLSSPTLNNSKHTCCKVPTYTAHIIKVYLIGLPQTPFLWAVFITIIVVAVIAVTGVTVYIIKIRKPRVASGSKGATTSSLPTHARNM
jgi:fatty-acid desaturase